MEDCENCVNFIPRSNDEIGECGCAKMDELTDDEAMDIWNNFGDATKCSKWKKKEV